MCKLHVRQTLTLYLHLRSKATSGGARIVETPREASTAVDSSKEAEDEKARKAKAKKEMKGMEKEVFLATPGNDGISIFYC